MSQPSAIAVDYNNTPHILYGLDNSGELIYANKTSGNWSYRGIYPELTYNGDIETDQQGYVHMIFSIDGQLNYVTDSPPPLYPKMSVTPTSIGFLGFLVGDTSTARQVTIKNNGEADLSLNPLKLAWPDSNNFSIRSTTCTNSLSPGSSCTAYISFNPQSIGNKTALLWIESNDPDNPVQSARLDGEGLGPLVTITGFQDFGEVLVGDSVLHTFTIKNIGNYYTIIQDKLIQRYDETEFHLRGLNDTYFRIDEGDSVQFSVVFKPTTTGQKSTRLIVFAAPNFNFNREITGTGTVPQFSISGHI